MPFSRPNLKISTRIISISLLIMALFCAAIFGFLLPNEEQEMRDSRRHNLQGIVQIALSLLADYQTKVKRGELSLEAAQKQALAQIRTLRYGHDDYIWINDTTLPYPTMIMHPTVPRLDGTKLDLATFDCATSVQYGDGPSASIPGGRKNLFTVFAEVARKSGHGYVGTSGPSPCRAAVLPRRPIPSFPTWRCFDRGSGCSAPGSTWTTSRPESPGCITGCWAWWR